MRPGCTCVRENLCELCLESTYVHLVGVAKSRGMLWADFVVRAVGPSDRPWPGFDERAAAVARRKVADLTADPRLLERFARACHEDAARRWAKRRR